MTWYVLDARILFGPTREWANLLELEAHEAVARITRPLHGLPDGVAAEGLETLQVERPVLGPNLSEVADLAGLGGHPSVVQWHVTPRLPQLCGPG